MNHTEPAGEAPHDPSPSPDWIPVAGYPDAHAGHEHALVLLAMGIPCALMPVDHGFDLQIDPSHAELARRELEAYALEQVPSPAPPLLPMGRSGTWTISLWMTALSAMFLWQGRDPAITGRLLSSSVAMVGNHEWWRAATALFIHADLPHLLGNLIAGGIFGTLVVRSIGPIAGLPAILASGTLGNAVHAWSEFPDDYRSLGASSAVFGALGILSAIGFRQMLRQQHIPWRRIASPLIAGVILLGWLGGAAPQANIDVAGHIAGFLFGCLIGLISPVPSPRGTSSEAPTP